MSTLEDSSSSLSLSVFLLIPNITCRNSSNVGKSPSSLYAYPFIPLSLIPDCLRRLVPPDQSPSPFVLRRITDCCLAAPKDLIIMEIRTLLVDLRPRVHTALPKSHDTLKKMTLIVPSFAGPIGYLGGRLPEPTRVCRTASLWSHRVQRHARIAALIRQ